MSDELYEKTFTKPIIRYGRFTNLLSLVLCFLPSILVWVVYGVKPSTQDILTGWGLAASVYAIYAVVEPISYFPILGLPELICLSFQVILEMYVYLLRPLRKKLSA